MALHTGTTGDETFILTDFERDSVVIGPDGGRDHITEFDISFDIVALNGFTTLDGFDDLEPFLTTNMNEASVTLDLSAADGGTPGAQTLTFDGMMSGLTKENILFNIEPDPLFFESDYVPTPPGGAVPINAGDGWTHSTGTLLDEPLAETPPPPPDCNLCNDVVLVPAWD
jgi:hypothetical protein